MILFLSLPAAGFSATVRFPADWRDDPTRVTLTETWGNGAATPDTSEWTSEVADLLLMLAERNRGIEGMRIRL